MDLLLPIFQLLYFVAHFLVSLLQACYESYQDLSQIIIYILKAGHHRPSERQLIEQAELLKKKPKHLAFLLTRNNLGSLNNLSHAIKWAVNYEVQYISIYDTQGILKQKWHALHESLSNLCPEVKFLKGPLMDNTPVEVDTHRVVVINLCSLEDGKQDLVQVVQKVIGVSEICENSVELSLVTRWQPNPDLIITVGQPISSMGFLPWQMKFSEFSSVSTLKRLNFKTFHSIMKSYSNCEQRFGK